MLQEIRNVIKKKINKLFIEDHNPLKALGLSITEMNERIDKMNLNDVREINEMKADLDFALEFSDVISSEEKQGIVGLQEKFNNLMG